METVSNDNNTLHLQYVCYSAVDALIVQFINTWTLVTCCVFNRQPGRWLRAPVPPSSHIPSTVHRDSELLYFKWFSRICLHTFRKSEMFLLTCFQWSLCDVWCSSLEEKPNTGNFSILVVILNEKSREIYCDFLSSVGCLIPSSQSTEKKASWASLRKFDSICLQDNRHFCWTLGGRFGQ